MQSNKLRMAIRSTAAVAILGVAAQANAIELDTGDYTTNLYGFARVAASYDLDENISSGGQAGNYALINTSGTDGADGHFGMDALTSRLGLSVMSPQGVKTVVEFDFDRDNTLTPRIRLAYGEYNGVLIGQNWSNYNSFVGTTPVLDWDGLPGQAGNQSRTAQIRYTTGPMSFSLEEQIAVSVEDANGGPESKRGLPVVTARLEDSQGGLSYSAAVMAEQIAVDDGNDDDSAFGYGAFVAGSIAVTEMIKVRGALNYADGSADAVYRSGSNGFAGFDAYTENAQGDLETVTSFGGTVGMSVNLGGGRSVNLGYGLAEQDLDDAADDNAAVGDDSERNSMLALNYQWSPVEKVNMGVEFARLERDNQDGSDGEANRLMFLAQYNF